MQGKFAWWWGGGLALAGCLALVDFAQAQEVATPPCNWMDVGPMQKQSGPFGVVAGPRRTAGQHRIWVAVRLGQMGKGYTLWRPYGPYQFDGGKKYLITVRDGTPPVVGVLPEDGRLHTFSRPTGTNVGIYFLNQSESHKFYGMAVCPGGPGPVVPPAAGRIVLNVNRVLGPGDPLDPVRGAHHHVLQVPMSEGSTYTIDMTSTAFDTYLRLLGPDGKQVASDDDGGVGLNARITYLAPRNGTYRIVATALARGMKGPYNLVVREVRWLTVMRQEGELTPSSLMRDGKYFRSYDVNLRLGRTYTIDMVSPQFDTFLILQNLQGQTVAQDDDSGEGLNARLRFQAPLDGTYRLIATSFNPRTQGRFTLFVREMQPN